MGANTFISKYIRGYQEQGYTSIDKSRKSRAVNLAFSEGASSKGSNTQTSGDGLYIRGKKTLISEGSNTNAGVREYKFRGTRVLVPGCEGISVGVRG